MLNCQQAVDDPRPTFENFIRNGTNTRDERRLSPSSGRSSAIQVGAQQGEIGQIAMAFLRITYAEWRGRALDLMF